MEVITKTQVPENKRLEFLPHFVGKHFITYERMIFNKLGEASNGQYTGGYWEFYTLPFAL